MIFLWEYHRPEGRIVYIRILRDKLILKASVQCDVSLKSIYRTCRIHVQEEVVGCM